MRVFVPFRALVVAFALFAAGVYTSHADTPPIMRRVVIHTPSPSKSYTIYQIPEYKKRSVKVKEVMQEYPKLTDTVQTVSQKNLDGMHYSAVDFNSSAEKSELKNIEQTLNYTLSKLPLGHRKALKQLEVRNHEHVSRGLANSKMIILHTGSIETEEELMSVLTHELGHVVALGYMAGQSTKQTPSEFTNGGKLPLYMDDPMMEFYRICWDAETVRKSECTRSDFVSGYGYKTNIHEDFAESYAAYRWQGHVFRELAKTSPKLQQKYAFMKTRIFAGREYQKNMNANAAQFTLTWDITKLDIHSHS